MRSNLISLDHTLDFEIWTPHKVYIEQRDAWKIMAKFYYLQEAVDLLMKYESAGIPCVLRCLNRSSVNVIQHNSTSSKSA